MLESFFNVARCDVLLDDGAAAADKLQTLIQKDSIYAEKAQYDPDFASIRDKIISMNDAYVASIFEFAADDTGEGVTITKYTGKESNLVIPQTHRGKPITSIGNNAFRACSNLTSVNIPKSVTSIGIGAFSGCSSLTSVNIPKSVTSIGIAAFRGCSRLTSLLIPEGVTIKVEAFKDCISLTTECREAIERKWGRRVF